MLLPGATVPALVNSFSLYLYENLEITPKTVDNGRLTEVVIHILDDDELSAFKADERGEEVNV